MTVAIENIRDIADAMHGDWDDEDIAILVQAADTLDEATRVEQPSRRRRGER